MYKKSKLCVILWEAMLIQGTLFIVLGGTFIERAMSIPDSRV